MKKIVVTGVAGFIGAHIGNKLSQLGYEVIGVDDLSTGKISNVPKNIQFIKLDLTDKDSYHLLPSDCEYIFHLAGQSSGEISFDNPVSDLSMNVVSTLNLIDFSIKNGIKKIVYASSMSVYGEVGEGPSSEGDLCKPLSCYGIGKKTAEEYIKLYGNKLPFNIFRMFNVYGPGQDLFNMRQGMVSIYIAQALKNNKIIVKGSPDRYRDFIYIDDVVNSWILALDENFPKNTILNLGTGVKTTVQQLLNTINNALNKHDMQSCEIEVQDGTNGDQTGIYANISELMKTFTHDYQFTSLKLGIEKFINSLIIGGQLND